MHTVIPNTKGSLLDNHSYVFPLPYFSRAVAIPTFPPDSIFKQASWLHWFDWAFTKAKNLAYNKVRPDLPINTRIRPSSEQALAYIKLAANSPIIAIDIETQPRPPYAVTSIAIAKSPVDSMCIPFARQYMEHYWSPTEELAIWTALGELFASDVSKVFHNYAFDVAILTRMGFTFNGILQDTMITANFLQPQLPKALKDVARLCCYCEPWKDRDDFELTVNADEFYRYNALDAARTLQCCVVQAQELTERNLTEFHDTRVLPLLPIVMDTSMRGIRVDHDKLANLAKTLDASLAPVLQTLNEVTKGLVPLKQIKRKRRDPERDTPEVKAYKTIIEEVPQPYNPSSGMQNKAILSDLGYRIPTRKGKETSDKLALLKLNRKRPHPFLTALIEYSSLNKLKTSYANLRLDPDGRCRSSYNIAGTKSGRFSARATPWDTGLNIQTIPRKTRDTNLRQLFIPDPGMTFVQVDLSQAELRVVAWLSGDHYLNELLDAKEDVHAWTAEQIQKITGIDCPRMLGKRINHASSYGMGPNKFADSCLADAGLAITAEVATRLLDARRQLFPQVYTWQDAIADTVRRTRRLASPHGRERYFYGLIEDGTIREALSFIPQATVVDTVSAAWVALSRQEGYNSKYHVLQQGHDSLLIEVYPDYLGQLMTQINAAFESQTMVINGIKRLIPHDIATGPTWGDMKDYESA